VEQKNWPVVRQQVGYGWYDTPQELEVLRELYSHLRLYVNFFQPQMKMVSKTRDGAKVTKRFDTARTPYRRVMESPFVDHRAKEQLTGTYLELNPAELKRAISALQDRLVGIDRTKPERRREVKPPPDYPFRETYSRKQLSRTSLVRQPVDASRTS
jgi:hypothetical protein